MAVAGAWGGGLGAAFFFLAVWLCVPGSADQLSVVVIGCCGVVCHHYAQLSPLGVNRRSERMVWKV